MADREMVRGFYWIAYWGRQVATIAEFCPSPHGGFFVLPDEHASALLSEVVVLSDVIKYAPEEGATITRTEIDDEDPKQWL